MTISIQSTTDSKEAVTAALGDLAASKPVEETKSEAPANEDKSDVSDQPEKVDSESDDSQAEPSDEEDTEAEELEAKSEDENQDSKPKKKGGFKKRIDRLNKRLSAIEQEKEYWRLEVLRTQQGTVQKNEATAQKATPETSNKPKVDDFSTHDEYVEALTDWKLDQKLASEKQRQREDALQTEAKTKLDKHSERVNRFAKAHVDWDEVIEGVANTQLSLTVQESIIDSEQGPELMYELAKNPKELARICSLSPIAAAREIGKIEARFSKPSEPSELKIKPKAPAPITPVRTRGASTVKSIYDESLSQREYEKIRAEELKQRARA